LVEQCGVEAAGIGKYDYGSIAIPLRDGKKRSRFWSVLRFAVDDIPNTLFLAGARWLG